MDTDEMSDEEIVRFVATLKRVRERGDEGRTAVVRTGDLRAVLDGWLTATRERDEARAEAERLRAELAQYPERRECPNCNGEGYVQRVTCGQCRGGGVIEVTP